MILAAVIFLYLYMLPCMAAFHGSIKQIIRDALYFIVKSPLRFIVIVFFDVFPFVLTYSDIKDLPLYAFIWVTCGFGLLAMLGSTLLLPLFRPFLEEKDESADDATDPYEDEYASMDDLRELDGF
jgi:uncharacterized membrane protein YesL